MRLMCVEELKILFGEFVTLTLALNVPREGHGPCLIALLGLEIKIIDLVCI